jgi:hypothetical protein
VHPLCHTGNLAWACGQMNAAPVTWHVLHPITQQWIAEQHAVRRLRRIAVAFANV